MELGAYIQPMFIKNGEGRVYFPKKIDIHLNHMRFGPKNEQTLIFRTFELVQNAFVCRFF